MKENYIFQVESLLNILAVFMKDKRWALKGGTAINFFYRDGPRLSVDIDLTYLPIQDRVTSFKAIHYMLKEAKDFMETEVGYKVVPSTPLNGKKETKLIVLNHKASIKVEPNFIFRAALFKPEIKSLSQSIAKEFEKESTKELVQANCLSFEDTYAGKICAALSRQHARDLFDIKILLENEGITKNLRQAFLVYLISTPRPVYEVLLPRMKDLSETFDNAFKGMARVKISLEDLEEAREFLLKKLKKQLTAKEKDFLIRFKQLRPDWKLLDLEGIENLPSVKWKLMNLEKLKKQNPRKYSQYLNQLGKTLDRF